MKKLIMVAVVLSIAVSAYGAVGDYTLFSSSRCWGNAAGDGGGEGWLGWVNFGGRSQTRMWKWRWQEGLVIDWDPDPILTWMAGYAPGTTFAFELQVMESTAPTGWPEGVFGNPLRWQVKTLNLDASLDWAEGNGGLDGRTVPFSWDKGTAAATNWYAQTYYTDSDDLPGSGDETPDYANCVQWRDVNGMAISQFQNSDNPGGGSPGLMLNTNGVYDQDQNGSIDPAENNPVYLQLDDPVAQMLTYVTVALDYDPTYPVDGPLPPLVNDLLTGSTNRGILFGPMEYYDDIAGQWVQYQGLNCVFYTNDQNAACWPYLKVEVIGEGPALPIVGDTQPDGCVDGLDYNTWSLNYLATGVPAWSAGGWTVGNFNEDATVDGLDYNAWSLNYLVGCSAGAEVPEPAVLSLLAVASLALIRRKRR